VQVAANGIVIRCQLSGPADAPWLIFSNSLATDLTMWDEQAAHFSRSYRILRYDQRGHGKSTAPAGRYKFNMLIDDVVALMDVLEISTAHICGLSMGGATALGLALRYPERIDRVVVCDSPCASTPTSAAQWEQRIAVAQSQGMTALAEPTVARWFPAEAIAADPPYLTKVRRMISQTPVAGFIGCAAALANHDFASHVESVTNPTLFVVGERDGAAPTAMREMHNRLCGSSFAELEGAGHLSNLDRPDLFNTVVEEFLRG
jgi:3-oxoadipate enol-lactonase